jgi:TetR/AcrR family transcriptional repressor of nem operon
MTTIIEEVKRDGRPRVPPEEQEVRLTQKQARQNREAILDAAGRLFRERGFGGVGVAELMEAAGFTHGGFYNHFPSKESLAAEVSAESIARSNERLATSLEELGEPGLRGFLSDYVSKRHRDNPGAGCTLAALASDAGRQGRDIQARFAAGLRDVLTILTGFLGRRASPRKLAKARQEAVRTYSEIVGAIVLARSVATADPVLSQEILEASRKAFG